MIKSTHMKQHLTKLFYIFPMFMVVGILCRINDWGGQNLFLLIALSGIAFYFLFKTINDLRKERDSITIGYQTLTVGMSVVLFAKYWHLNFGDYPGYLLIPLFIVASLWYLIKQQARTRKLSLVSLLYLLLIMPMFGLECERGPLQYLPQGWHYYNNPFRRNEKWVWVTNFNHQQGKWIQQAAPNTFQNGKYTRFYANGQMFEKGTLREGNQVDSVLTYDLNGKLVRIVDLTREPKHETFLGEGIVKLYYPTTELQYEAQVKAGKVVGTWILYNKNGHKKQEGNRISDNGWVKNYYDNGFPQDSANTINGLQSGTAKYWNEKGQLTQISQWRDAKRNGQFTEFYDTGELYLKCYFENDIHQGDYWVYHKNGNIKESTTYVNGLAEGGYVRYYESGRVFIRGSFAKGKRDGQSETYYENGALFSREKFDHGIKQDSSNVYSHKGRLFGVEYYDTFGRPVGQKTVTTLDNEEQLEFERIFQTISL